jgi:hypothetical protein
MSSHFEEAVFSGTWSERLIGSDALNETGPTR